MSASQLPVWSNFNALGQSKIVKSSYVWTFVVPVAAKLLSAIPEGAIFQIGSSGLKFALGVPFSWEMIYYASLSFATATLIYEVFCPEIVKRYSRYSDFAGEGKGSEQVLAYAYGRNAPHGGPQHEGLSIEALLHFLSLYSQELKGIDPKDGDYSKMLKAIPIHPNMDPAAITVGELELPAAFWMLRDTYDVYGPVFRGLTGIFYAVGFLFVAAIIVQNFWFVFSRHQFF